MINCEAFFDTMAASWRLKSPDHNQSGLFYYLIEAIESLIRTQNELKQVFLLLFQHLFVPLQPLNMYNQIKMLLKVSASDADLHLSRSHFEPLPTPKAVTLSFCLKRQT